MRFLIFLLSLIVPLVGHAGSTGTVIGGGGGGGSVTGMDNPASSTFNLNGNNITNGGDIAADSFSVTDDPGNNGVGVDANTTFTCPQAGQSAGDVFYTVQGDAGYLCHQDGTLVPVESWELIDSEDTAGTDYVLAADDWLDNYIRLQIRLIDVYPSDAATQIRFRPLDNGTDENACEEWFLTDMTIQASPTLSGIEGTSTACRMYGSVGISNAATEGMFGTIEIYPDDGDDFFWHGTYRAIADGTIVTRYVWFSGEMTGATPTNGWDGFTLDAIGGGNVNGRAELWGLRK